MTSLDDDLRSAQESYQRKDFVRAYNKYLSLSKNGHGDSQVFLGWMIQNGIGTQIDLNESALWFERAASLGSVQGAFYYGRYLTTQGRDEQALEWYRTAANKGDIASIFRVGYSLVRGKGTAIDIHKGYQYLLSAAADGNIFAKREVGILDVKGNRGFIYRVTGFFGLLYAIFSGIIVSLINSNSDSLRK